ncbi:peptide chain release factor 2 [Candidatus Peregrinibacteria bacterium]|nr:peptide chain release factor 2 [Candidatus Peregrinibacteria bacterium]
MQELKPRLDELNNQILRGLGCLDIPKLKKRAKELEDLTSAPEFWKNQNQAREISQELKHLQTVVKDWEAASRDIKELLGLFPTIQPEKDPKAAEDFRAMVAELEKRFDRLNRESFFSGKYDANNAILMVHAGTGGKDAQDWAEMLLRMYMRYAERRDWKTELLDESRGEEAGIKSATILVSGTYAYAYLKGEKGVHRLVRLSPFNSAHSRETSFALIEIMPEVPDTAAIEIKPEEIEMDAFRSGGKGGQNVNKVSSAVRLTHIPTGIVAHCQSERSQLQNRQRAMKILQGKLAALAEEKRTEEIKELKGKRVEMSWGNQIRSYVLHPYTMVKDHRTDYETSQTDKVLDGELDGFVEAEIEWMNTQKAKIT